MMHCVTFPQARQTKAEGSPPFPPHMKKVFYDDRTDTVYVSVQILTGPPLPTEFAVLESMPEDVPVYTVDGHAYIPTWWIRREHPTMWTSVSGFDCQTRQQVRSGRKRKGVRR